MLYFPKFRHVKFKTGDFLPKGKYIIQICRLGFSSFAFQSSTLVVQVVLNNLLRTYGAQSVYGSEITIAVAGIMQKINAIFVAVVIGVVQGSQPICSFTCAASHSLNTMAGTERGHNRNPDFRCTGIYDRRIVPLFRDEAHAKGRCDLIRHGVAHPVK